MTVATMRNNGNRVWENSSFPIPDNLKEIIQETVINEHAHTADRMVWGLTNNYVFFVHSTYSHIAASTLTNTTTTSLIGVNPKSLWKSKLPNKIRIFLRILLYKRTTTSHRLHTIGMTISPSCAICNNPKEDLDHLFFHCESAKVFWAKIIQKKSHLEPTRFPAIE